LRVLGWRRPGEKIVDGAIGMVVDDLDEHVGEVNVRTDAEGKRMARSTEAIVEPSILTWARSTAAAKSRAA
jgi:hypothetical protein